MLVSGSIGAVFLMSSRACSFQPCVARLLSKTERTSRKTNTCYTSCCRDFRPRRMTKNLVSPTFLGIDRLRCCGIPEKTKHTKQISLSVVMQDLCATWCFVTQEFAYHYTQHKRILHKQRKASYRICELSEHWRHPHFFCSPS